MPKERSAERDASPLVTPPPCTSSAPPSAPSAKYEPSKKFSSRVDTLHRRLAEPAPPPAKRRRMAHAGPPAVRVPACCDCCEATDSDAALAWCATEVAIPHTDWAAVMQAVAAPGAEALPMDEGGLTVLPGGIRVRQVTRADQLPAALRALRDSMAGQDAVVGVDMEWKPDGWRPTGSGSGGGSAGPAGGSSKVALLQLASASLVLLVRISRLGFSLPPALAEFFRDPSITVVGYSWREPSADEAKALATFGAGRGALFARYFDVQEVAEALGYHGFGLGTLTRQVLGFEPLGKSRKVALSNWASWRLSSAQVQYAALDALITRAVFCSLRLWHASPSSCTSCGHLLGRALPPPQLRCRDCGSGRSFSNVAAAASHARSTGHARSWQSCGECGRTCGAGAARLSSSSCSDG